MCKKEFEIFVTECGKDILNFCIMTTASSELGHELYQDTMLKLLEKKDILNPDNNVKSYALSIAIFLWKNRKRKFAIRNRIAPVESIENTFADNSGIKDSDSIIATTDSVEELVISEIVASEIRKCVSSLPEKYRLVIYLQYSSNMKQEEIAACLHIPLGTVKSRTNKAKKILKKRLEDLGYDG